MIDDFGAPGPKKLAPKLKTNSPVPQPKPAIPAFETPEEVAARDPEPETVSEHSEVAETSHKIPGHHWFNLPWPPNKEEIILSSIVLLMAIAGITGFLVLHKTPAVAPVKQQVSVKTVKAVPTTVASTLSGLPVAPATNQLPVTGVMIENSLDARPQAGLSQAGVVFEAIAEAGITRFLALYQDQTPTNIGPVRSIRPYYLQWDLGFDAPIAHVGGSADALADVSTWHLKDLNQFYNGGSYHRITTREAPHNVYTGVDTLHQLETTKGYTSSVFSGFPRKADAPSKLPSASSIDIAISSSDYNVHYDYAATTNSYNRSEGGAPQLDANSNAQLSPKVVITIVVPESQGTLDASGAYYSDYNVLGSGVATIFQDGTATTGTWSKPTNTSQISFSNAAGQPIKLNAGQTWISAVTAANAVSYK